MAEVGPFRRSLFARIPESLFRVDVVEAIVVALIESDAVQDEELQLRPEVRRVADTDLLQVGLGFLCDMAGVPAVPLASHGIHDVADQAQRGNRGERVHHR